MNIPVSLTLAETMMAAQVGINRHGAAIKNGNHDKHGADGPGWNFHIEGACGECCVAKYLNVHWDGSVNTFRTGNDVGAWQVRTRSRHSYELPIRKDDDVAKNFILVTGIAPRFIIRGYFLAGEARAHDDWWQDYGNRGAPAWFVPQNVLRDFGPASLVEKAA